MSASLVGSEMCIRDRLLAAWDCSPSGRSSATGMTTSMLCFSARRASKSCLLYTSDAADDM
eukprot:13583964-Alexandrium_andersonii.AAC.1